MQIKRKPTKIVKLGNILIGGGNPVSIQSMTNTPLSDIPRTRTQIERLVKAGCEIVRIAVNEPDGLPALAKITKTVKVPIEADIHFHYKLALGAIDAGVAGVRLNPGNIFRAEEIKQVVSAAKKKKIPLRVGINSGSLPGRYARWRNQPKAMVQAALEYIAQLESYRFFDTMVSLKASDVGSTIYANQLFSRSCAYPLHLGVTASGLVREGTIKSSIGIGALLAQGIGDTIRVSLAGDPVEEVVVAKGILSGLGLRHFGPSLIACPTCGRCQIDVEKIGTKVSEYLHMHAHTLRNSPIRLIAVMGCVVNGPGEAKDADLAVFGGKGCGVICVDGVQVKKVPYSKIAQTLIHYISG